MSLTAEDIRARIAQASGGLTAEQVRARLAQAPGAATPVPAVTNPTMEQVAASFTKPILETAEGVQSLNLKGNPLRRGLERRQAGTQEALDWAQSTQAPGAAGTGAGILGELSIMALPASKASSLMKALTKVRGAPLTAEAATVGLMEGIKSPGEGETRGENALTGFGLTLAPGMGQAALRSALAPRMFRRTPMAQEEMGALRAAGIKPDIPMSMGQPGRGTEGTGGISKLSRWMHRRPLAAIPPTQGIIRGQQEKALGDWRQMILQKAVPEGVNRPVPPSSSLRPMEDSMEAIGNWYSAEYKQLLDPFQFDVMSPNAPLSKTISKVYQNIAGKGPQREVSQKISDLLSTRTSGQGTITGGDVSALKTALRKEAKSAATRDGVVESAYYDLIEAIDDGVETQLGQINPKIAKDYKRLRAPYRNFITIDDAVGKSQFGEFTPKTLDQAGRSKATGEKINLRKAPLRQEAQRGMAVYDVPTNTESNMFQVGALIGSTAAGVTNPWTGALTAGAYLGSGAGLIPGGTRYMAGEMVHQKALSELLRKPGMQELSRAARIGGGQYVAE